MNPHRGTQPSIINIVEPIRPDTRSKRGIRDGELGRARAVEEVVAVAVPLDADGLVGEDVVEALGGGGRGKQVEGYVCPEGEGEAGYAVLEDARGERFVVEADGALAEGDKLW